ncbi:uncharacterized protein LOC119636685 [Glossina fuscipes]|uniref:Uncharacterized protein LOC119636685 n=1 Tax=Glossina fuscipes TaxID=7396 RepID=A0A9C6DR50_9MUSC|nr:uncharacterized protein LOC119636685 [Glossina fuscipes]KAI9582779.1 hypothetical protein GQX74_011996 [Glossina fuscipes]
MATHIHRVNNSYESEPSSGEPSSHEQSEYYPNLDDENINLPYLLRPPSYDNEVTVVTTSSPSNFITNNQSNTNNMEASKLPLSKECELRFGIPAGEEFSFEGFDGRSFGQIKHLVKIRQQPENCADSDKFSSGKYVFPKFYDTLIGENSCNAMDLPVVSTEHVVLQKLNSGNHSQLSFNGKISQLPNSLTASEKGSSHHCDQRSYPLAPASSELSNYQPFKQFSRSFILKKYSNEKSPDLFGDDDDDDDDENGNGGVDNQVEMEKDNQYSAREGIEKSNPTFGAAYDTLENCSFNCPTESSFVNDEQTGDVSFVDNEINGKRFKVLFRENCRREKEFLKRIRKCLAGVLPPPSITIPQLDMFEAILTQKDEILNFFCNSTAHEYTSTEDNKCESLLKPTHTLEDTKNMPWKDVLAVRQHGLSYNLNEASESNEYLNLSIVERFIGAETASSYENVLSNIKRHNARIKQLCQSPGSRLSHLARRRAVFSSANLANASQRSQTLIGPQILVDKTKGKNRRKENTPKRKTPGSKKKNRKTPTSSARKRLFRNDIKPGPSRETSKRALFQSPAKQSKPSVSRFPTIKPELANRVEKSKRALLFSPNRDMRETASYFSPNSAKLDALLKRKRDPYEEAKDNDNSVELAVHSSKLFKANDASALTPRSLKIKSQSFCIGTNNLAKKQHVPTGSNILAAGSLSSTGSNLQLFTPGSTESAALIANSRMQRAYSDMTAPAVNGLTDNQKKKLLWAVSQALQEKRKIGMKHENFKEYAAILAKVVRRIFQEYYRNTSTSTNETMLRLAKRYVYQVTAGASVDEIYLQAKQHIEESKRSMRLSGYIGPEEFEKLQLHSKSCKSQPSSTLASSNSTQNISARNNSIDNVNELSQSSFKALITKQTSFLDQLSHSSGDMQQLQSSSGAGKLPIASNGSQQNSSSKSNLNGVVLRENVDCDLKRSAQKNFTGKDQRNKSPYACREIGGGGQSSAVKAQTHLHLVSELNLSNCAKARRQITFDS